MINNATVISIDEKRATVAVERSSACTSCASRAGCVGCAETVTAVVGNPVGALPGDRVEIYAPDSRITLLSLITFVMPVALPFTGYFAIRWLFGETAGYIAMAALFAASVAALILLDRFYLRGKNAAKIERIVERVNNF
jgi:positive regulator of sigma E activity